MFINLVAGGRHPAARYRYLHPPQETAQAFRHLAGLAARGGAVNNKTA